MLVGDPFAKLREAPAAPKKIKNKDRRRQLAKACSRPLLRKFLKGERVTSGELADEPELAKLDPPAHAKALGDCCGKGENGLDLFRGSDDSYLPCWENGSKVVRQYRTTEDLEVLAKDVGQPNAEAMIEAINNLPSHNAC